MPFLSIFVILLHPVFCIYEADYTFAKYRCTAFCLESVFYGMALDVCSELSACSDLCIGLCDNVDRFRLYVHECEDKFCSQIDNHMKDNCSVSSVRIKDGLNYDLTRNKDGVNKDDSKDAGLQKMKPNVCYKFPKIPTKNIQH